MTLPPRLIAQADFGAEALVSSPHVRPRAREDALCFPAVLEAGRFVKQKTTGRGAPL